MGPNEYQSPGNIARKIAPRQRRHYSFWLPSRPCDLATVRLPLVPRLSVTRLAESLALTQTYTAKRTNHYQLTRMNHRR